MSAPTIIVAGLGRCGTSMLMQMLHRGGVPCVGVWPAFEPEESWAPTPEFIADSAGKAVKVLDPQRVGLPGDVRVIWLDRDHREQAKSHAKFMNAMLGRHIDRAGRRVLAAGMARDTQRAMEVIGSRPLMRLRFEEVLQARLAVAYMLEAFIQRPAFDAEAAANAVLKRQATCTPGLDVELSLMRAAA